LPARIKDMRLRRDASNAGVSCPPYASVLTTLRLIVARRTRKTLLQQKSDEAHRTN
jgi:hypothetical protein